MPDEYFEEMFELEDGPTQKEMEEAQKKLEQGNGDVKLTFNTVNHHFGISCWVYEIKRSTTDINSWYLRIRYPLPLDRNRVTFKTFAKKGTMWKKVEG